MSGAEDVLAAPFETVEVLRLWSVTTLIKMGLGTGEGLIRWGNNEIAAAAIDKRGSLERRLQEDGREETIRWLAGHRFRKSEKAKVRGTDVHAIAEKLALGIDPGPIAPDLAPYVDQLSRWLRKWQPRFLMAECPVYNVSRRYAGTCDGLMELGGRTVIFDYKTTDKGPEANSRPPYSEVALQLAAYARAELVGVLAEQRYSDGKRYYLYDPTVEHEPMPPVDAALCIVISPFDCFAVRVSIDEEVWAAFRAVQSAARFQSETVRRIFGAVLDNSEVDG